MLAPGLRIDHDRRLQPGLGLGGQEVAFGRAEQGREYADMGRSLSCVSAGRSSGSPDGDRRMRSISARCADAPGKS